MIRHRDNRKRAHIIPIKHCILIGLAIACLVFSSCKRESSSSARNGFIALVMPHGSELGDVMLSGAVHTSESLNGPPIRYFEAKGPTQKEQNELLTQLEQENMVALCIQVEDPIEASPALERLRGNNVLLVTLITEVPTESTPFPYCGSDPYETGVTMANSLVQALDGKGIIAIVRPDEEGTPAVIRYTGFTSVLDHHPLILVLHDINTNSPPQALRQEIKELCERYPSLDALASMDDRLLKGYNSSEPPIVPDRCRLFSLDAFPSRWEDLEKGRCFALVGPLNYPDCSGTAVQMCIATLKGHTLGEGQRYTKTGTIEQEDLKAWKRRWEKWEKQAEQYRTQDSPQP